MGASKSWMRLTVLAIGAILLCAQMHRHAHTLKVAHVTCEHGLTIHAGAAPVDSSAHPALDGGDGASTAHSHGCALLLLSRVQQLPAANVSVSPRPPLTGHVVPVSPATPRGTVLRNAPARSPPL